MKFRDLLKQLLHRFERAITRVEDQGVRVEQSVDNVVEQLTRLSDAVYSLKTEIITRDARREGELHTLKGEISVLRRKLEGAPKH